jgi:tetratricopeptide (TPR) repeat protein
LIFDTLNTNTARIISSEIWLKSLDINNGDIEGYYNRAVSKMKQNYCREAIKDLDNILQFDTTISSVFGLKGYCLLVLNKNDSALNLINKAVKLDERNNFAYYALGVLYFVDNQYLNAKTAFRNALELNDNDPGSNYYSGKIALSENDILSAKTYFKNAIKTDPAFLEAYIGLCSAYMSAGQNLTALSSLEDGSKYLDGKSEYHYTCAVIQSVLGNYQKAIKELNNCLEIDKGNFKALINRGILFIVQKDYPSGFADIKYALTDSIYFNNVLVDESLKRKFFLQTNTSGNHLMADSILYGTSWKFYQSGYCKYITGDYNGAFDDLSTIISSSKNLFEPYELRAKILMIRGDYQLAESDFKSAIQLTRGTFFSFINLAATEYQQNDIKNINKNLIAAMTLEPDNPEIYKILAEFNLLNPQTAIIYYNKVLELEPSNFNVLLKNAELKKENGFATEAISDYKKLILLFPDFMESYYSIAEIETSINQTDSAKLILKTAIAVDSNNYTTYLLLSRVYSFEKGYENAIFYINKAIDKNREIDKPYTGENYELSFELGILYQNSKRYNEALSEYKKLVSANKQSIFIENYILSDCYNNMAVCYDSINDLKLAIKYNKLSIRQKEVISQYLNQRGENFRHGNQIKASEIDFNKAFVIDSLCYMGYITLAQKYFETAELKNSIKALKDAIQLDTIKSEAYLQLSKIYLTIKDFFNSLKYAEIASNKDYSSAEALFYKSISELKLGEIEDSRRTFTQFAEVNCKYKYREKTAIFKTLDEFISENSNSLEFKQILNNFPCN